VITTLNNMYDGFTPKSTIIALFGEEGDHTTAGSIPELFEP